MPTAVTFRGMPSNRFWEMEDGAVNLANVVVAEGDVARALLVTYALEFGNDWFVVPFEMPVGSVAVVRALVVTNTFGEKLLVRHTTAVDGPASPWRMFGLSTPPADGGTAPKFIDSFFLPPTLGVTMEAEPLEDVLLLRDEMANMAWAIERTIESASGRQLDRHETWAANQPAAPASAGNQYRLGSTVPDYWIPFLPVQSGQTVQLRRGAMPTTQPRAGTQPLGRILVPGGDLLLRDEEVPREGARVTRSYQYARWTDGSTHLWIGRRKQPGRGEGSSGLRFDVVE
jgi:hypothetical protein